MVGSSGIRSVPPMRTSLVLSFPASRIRPSPRIRLYSDTYRQSIGRPMFSKRNIQARLMLLTTMMSFTSMFDGARPSKISCASGKVIPSTSMLAVFHMASTSRRFANSTAFRRFPSSFGIMLLVLVSPPILTWIDLLSGETIRAHGDRLDAMGPNRVLASEARFLWFGEMVLDHVGPWIVFRLLGWLSRLGRLRLGCRWRGSGFIGFGNLDRRIADGGTDVVGVEFEAAALLPPSRSASRVARIVR